MDKFSLDIPRMGYLLVYRTTGSFIQNAIEKVQLDYGFSKEEAEYTHVEVSGGGQWATCIEPPFSKDIDITKRYAGRHVKIMRLKPSIDKEYYHYWRSLAKISRWAATKTNLPYDVRGVLSFVFPFIGQSKHLNFCSENAIWAIRKEYPFVLASIQDSKIMPAHFLCELYFDLVWEGDIPLV